MIGIAYQDVLVNVGTPHGQRLSTMSQSEGVTSHLTVRVRRACPHPVGQSHVEPVTLYCRTAVPRLSTETFREAERDELNSREFVSWQG